MKRQTIYWLCLGVISVMLFLIAAGCEEITTPPTGPSTKPTTTPTPVPTGSPGNLSGTVVGTIYKQPLAGIKVSANGRSTTTGSDGTFLLTGVGEGVFTVTLEGSAIYRRRTTVDTTQKQPVELDSIERNSNFHLDFYHELTRTHRDAYNNVTIHPTRRWIKQTPPTLYINTNANWTIDGVIDADTIELVRSVITQVVPVFTGGFYSSLPIKTQRFSDYPAIPEHAIVFSFDDTLINNNAYGSTVIYFEGNRELTRCHISILDDKKFYGGFTQEEIAAHELGHSFGFEHGELLPSVMFATRKYGWIYSPADQLHMRIMYSRPAGSTYLDNDPLPGAKLMGPASGKQIFIDNRANFTLSPEEREQLRALPGRSLVEY